MTDIAATVNPGMVDLVEEKRKKDLLGWLRANQEMMINMRRPFEQQWYTNIAFYMGRQWVVWTGPASTGQGTFMLVEPPAPRWRVRLVVNKVKPMIRNEFTKLTKEEPQFFVNPQTADDTDIAAARAAEQINEYLLDTMRFNRRRRQATLWSVITGVGILKIYYNQNKKLNKTGPVGAPVLESITPFNLYVPNIQIEDLEEQPFITHEAAYTPTQIYDAYGVKVKADSSVGSGVFEQRLQGVLGIKNVGQNLNTVRVRETWIKPCGKFPEGNMVVWVSDQIIHEEGSWPYEHGHYPFVKIDHVPVPGRFYGQSVIEDVVPIQKEYNKTRSQLIESKNRMSKPQLIAAKGSVDPKKITSEPGLIIEYQAGFAPPQPLPLQPVPGYVIQELDRLLQDIDDLSGQYEITKGRTPPGVEAASAIAYLQEENDTRLFHTVASIEDAVQEIGFQSLCLVQQYWEEKRLVKVVSKNGIYETRMFKGSDLKNNVDLRVETQSMAPRSKAAKQAFITELMKMGAIPMDKGLERLELSDLQALYNEMQIDKRQAQRENWVMSTMKPVAVPVTGPDGQPQLDMFSQPQVQKQYPPLPTNDFDNDEVHIMVHENYMKSQEYELLPPELKQLFMEHDAWHKQKVVQMMTPPQQPGDQNAAGTGTGTGSQSVPGSNGSKSTAA